MLTRSVVIEHEQVFYSTEAASVPLRRPLLVNLTLLVYLVSALLVFVVVTTVGAQDVIQMPDLPEVYLPNNPMPQNASCYQYTGEPDPRCSVRLSEHEVYFNFDTGTRIITQTLIPAREYTIGQMVAAWGRPTGITRKDTMVYVHWGARSALLYTRDFQPNDPVEFILYDLEPLPASTWRGFRLFE